MTKVSHTESSSTSEEKLTDLKTQLREKIPGLEYLEDFRLTQTGLINLLNDVLGTDGWQQQMRDVSKQQLTKNEDGTHNCSYMVCLSIKVKGVGTQESFGVGYSQNQKSEGEAIQSACTAAKANAMVQTARLFGPLLGNSLYEREVQKFLKTVEKPAKKKFTEAMLYHRLD